MPVLLLLLIGLPLVEIYLMFQVGAEIGALPTLALTLLSALFGIWLVRLQGIGLLIRVTRMAAVGEVPAIDLLDGALILGAGLLLLLPGFLTDTLGFLLLIPRLRHGLIRRMATVAPAPGQANRPGERRPRIIEGEFRRED